MRVWTPSLKFPLGSSQEQLTSFVHGNKDIPRVVVAARQASSMQGNPIVLTDAELHEALGAAIPV